MIEAPTKEPRDLHGPDGVRVEVVSRTFRTKRGEVDALAGMSLRAQPGEIVAVVGPSGCGKTTLLELICGLQTADSGSVNAAPAALMPQRDLLLPWLTALDNAGLALRARGVSRAQARAAAAPWLERFGLAGFEGARPAELSGGMRQRVSFLRTLLAGKPVLALDEPFAALDAITRAEMQGWLAQVLDERAAHRRPGDPRRRGSGDARRPRGRDVSAPRARPGRDRRRRAATATAYRPVDRGAARTRARGAGGADVNAVLPSPARRFRAGWGAAIVLLVLLGAWELYVDAGGADPLILPAPHAVAKAMYTDRSLLWSNFLVTAQ